MDSGAASRRQAGVCRTRAYIPSHSPVPTLIKALCLLLKINQLKAKDNRPGTQILTLALILNKSLKVQNNEVAF